MWASFGGASSAWAGLDSATQGQWASYAASHPIVNGLGQSVYLDGHAMFVAIVTNRTNSGLAASTAVPTSDTVPSLTGQVGVVLTTAPVFTVSCTAFVSGGKVLVQAGPVRSGGRAYEGKWRQWAIIGTFPGTPTDIQGDYSDQWGNPLVDQVVFVRFTPINPQGVRGVPVVYRAVCVAD
jgi:hypothetical protein